MISNKVKTMPNVCTKKYITLITDNAVGTSERLKCDSTSYAYKSRLSTANKVNRLFPRRSPVWTPLVHGEWIIVNFDDAEGEWESRYATIEVISR